MSLADLPKQYDPQAAQDRWYAFWLEKGYFHANLDPQRPPYCIVIPPPNVTGALHLGHALNNTLQDILVRWRRMQGHDALWMPGTDHAGIATQAVVERRLLEEQKKTRHDLGRDALVERIWAWKAEYEARILSQLRLMGCSCDWDRTRFTLDEMCSKAVRRTFLNLFRAGKIFRGKRLVNWDVQLRTAVADDEIYTEEVAGHIWTIKYPVAGSATGESLHVATTRPETMLGDTAVAVHPDDARYRHLIGRMVDLPLTHRQIPIIADPVLVDPAFGTGCVKVTPAHDPNDYQAGLRNRLPMINLLNPDGTYNSHAGVKYQGLDRIVVRKRVLADLKEAGLLERTDSHLVPLKHSDRSKSPIEPYLSDQWFVAMGDGPNGSPGFAQQAIDAVTSDRLKIHPERYKKSYIDWLAEKRDWCISRQLWWGHQIPVWTIQCADDVTKKHVWDGLHQDSAVQALLTSEHAAIVFVPDEELEAAKNQGQAAYDRAKIERPIGAIHACLFEDYAACVNAFLDLGLERDPDVLDTWFSSALWTHSTLGWPHETPELAKFYPTSVLSTARDIITLWVARMVIFGQFNRGDVPFRDVYIHPVILDGHGVRMSKSKGNGVDPVDIIDLYGADALRFALAALATETQDIRLPVEKAKLADGREVNTSERFELARPFANKLWNAARFALMNLEGYTPAPVAIANLPIEDRWILSLLTRTAREATADLDRFGFADYARKLRDFTWNDFCDWYLEFLKGRLRDPAQRSLAQRILAAVLDGLCRLLHPIMPFVTEEIWQALNSIAPNRGLPEPTAAAESVCIAPWPDYPQTWMDEPAEAIVGQWQAVTAAIRNLRSERNIAPAAKIRPILIATTEVAQRLTPGLPFLQTLTNAESLAIVPQAERMADSVVAVLPDCEIILPLAGLIDLEAERARHRKTLADLDKQRAAVQGKLANESFVARAPAEVVTQQRAKLAEIETQRASIQELLAALDSPR